MSSGNAQIEIAGLIHGNLCAGIRNNILYNGVEVYGFSVPVLGVLRIVQFLILGALQHEGTGINVLVSGSGEVHTELLNLVLANRHELGAGTQQGQEVRGRGRQNDLNGVVVGSGHADLLNADLAAHSLVRVHDIRSAADPGIGGSGLRIHQSLETINNVLRGQRLAVGPLQAFTQMEGIGQQIFGDIPGLSQAGLISPSIVRTRPSVIAL